MTELLHFQKVPFKFVPRPICIWKEVKGLYMQAWISLCLEKELLFNWSSYLHSRRMRGPLITFVMHVRLIWTCISFRLWASLALRKAHLISLQQVKRPISFPSSYAQIIDLCRRKWKKQIITEQISTSMRSKQSFNCILCFDKLLWWFCLKPFYLLSDWRKGEYREVSFECMIFMLPNSLNYCFTAGSYEWFMCSVKSRGGI